MSRRGSFKMVTCRGMLRLRPGENVSSSDDTDTKERKMSRPRWAKKLQRQIEDLDECITELADDLEIDLDEAADSRAGGLAALRRTFSPLATGGPAENVGGGPGVEVTGILSGPRGEAAVDGADARAQARGRERAAENREDREAARRRGEVPVETTGILSGPRGESALDRD